MYSSWSCCKCNITLAHVAFGMQTWYDWPMKILWRNHVPLENIADNNGFGYATERVVTSLRELGHTVSDKMENPDVEFWFDQPQWVEWRSDAYRILYVPWESTELPAGWLDKMNSADEVWTPSPTVAEWFVSAGVIKPVYVYLHGVDNIWTPVQRVWEPSEGRFQMFHHGGEAVRKGLWDKALPMFVENFRSEATFNLKTQIEGWSMPVPGVHFFKEKMPIGDLVRLYHDQHLMVYPSWGEGFGLAPLQAMATSMPVLITGGWAPYEYLLPTTCVIDSKLVDSPWPELHPGKVLEPDYDDMVDKTRYIMDNYSDFAQWFECESGFWRSRFQWRELTHKMFWQLKNRLEI